MENTICIGKIVKAIGLKGEVKVLPFVDNLSRFKKLGQFFVQSLDDDFTCENVSLRNDFVVIKIKGFDKVEDVSSFINKEIYVKREDAVSLSENQFFIVDLVGASLVENEKVVGEIIDVENYGANDILVIIQNGKEYRVPFLKEIYENFDIENKKFYITKRFWEVMV